MGEGLKRAIAAAKATRRTPREHLIATGIGNLKEYGYGYQKVTPKNILTDMIYSALFDQMLKDSLIQSPNGSITAVINELRAEIARNTK